MRVIFFLLITLCLVNISIQNEIKELQESKSGKRIKSKGDGNQIFLSLIISLFSYNLYFHVQYHNTFKFTLFLDKWRGKDHRHDFGKDFGKDFRHGNRFYNYKGRRHRYHDHHQYIGEMCEFIPNPHYLVAGDICYEFWMNRISNFVDLEELEEEDDDEEADEEDDEEDLDGDQLTTRQKLKLLRMKFIQKRMKQLQEEGDEAGDYNEDEGGAEEEEEEEGGEEEDEGVEGEEEDEGDEEGGEEDGKYSNHLLLYQHHNHCFLYNFLYLDIIFLLYIFSTLFFILIYLKEKIMEILNLLMNQLQQIFKLNYNLKIKMI
jgi:hypothetical protein